MDKNIFLKQGPQLFELLDFVNWIEIKGHWTQDSCFSNIQQYKFL